MAEPEAVWSEGTTRLLDYGIGGQGRMVLFIPSLINRGYILDLSEQRSLMRDLAKRGFRPLLVDWDAPGDQEAGFSLDDYIAGRLHNALQAACGLNQGPVAVAGYCMGGTLAMGLTALAPEQVSALVLMAAPWDFSAIDPAKTRVLETMIPVFDTLLKVTPTLPVDVLQAMFASLHPTLTAHKFRALASLNMRSAKARHFVALEEWLNDGVALAGPTARECFRDWYIENLPGRGTWKIASRAVLPETFELPSLVVVPLHDHIVPPGSSLPLADKLPQADCLEIQAGHIGMVAGTRAKTTLYSPLAQWLDNILS